MLPLIQFFITYAPLFYLILGISILFAVRGLIKATKEKQRAIFGLEHEISHGHLRVSIAVIVLLVLLFLTVFILQRIVGPDLPSYGTLPTPTLEIISIPTEAASGSYLNDPDALSSISESDSNCITGQIMILSPVSGEVISGDVTVIGTADIPNFGFYKYEFSVSSNSTWNTILAGREIVREGELGHWDTSQLPAGDYLLRLIVMDNQGKVLPACIVPVRISSQ